MTSPDDPSADGSLELQKIIDSIFCYNEFLNLSLSVTIADPSQPDCPLIACSAGFTDLTGYSVQEIVGRNCRFLLNGVPADFIDDETRIKCRAYVAMGQDPTALDQATANDACLADFLKSKAWASLTKGEIICVQTNATKTGELFKNMFYMKQVQLNDQSFILGLQARLPEEWETTVDTEKLEEYCQQAFGRLGKNMTAVERVLSQKFWYSAQVRRQDAVKTVLPACVTPLPCCGIAGMLLYGREPMTLLHSLLRQKMARVVETGEFAWTREVSTTSSYVPSPEDEDGKLTTQTTCDVSTAMDPEKWSAGGLQAPEELHTGFDPSDVMEYDSRRFRLVRKIEDANRNQGCVCLMKDLHEHRFVAAKQMPNSWVNKSHSSFQAAHPSETEQPWNDIGCTAFLESIGYPYSVGLVGVFRDAELTSVVSEFVSGGDLFNWATDVSDPPGFSREELVKPLAKQLARGIQQLHELSIVHGDLSVENILLSADAGFQVKIIDFGAATTSRWKTSLTGKPSYQAPEVFGEEECDGFLFDAFAFGVILYAVCLLDYPWMCTQGRGDKCFQYVKLKGFRAFAKKRKLPSSKKIVENVTSPELLHLLEGLLELDPAKRLTLGESVYGGSRRSVWDEPWMQ